jgi:MraZ protein
VDTKGRFLLPSGFRKQLPKDAADRFVIKQGFEHCITLYPMESWNEFVGQLNTLNDLNSKVREFKRMLLNGVSPVDLDNAGRILLPKNLLEHAGITKDIIFLAQGDIVEIWDKATYNDYYQQRIANFSNLADEITGGNFLKPSDGFRK